VHKFRILFILSILPLSMSLAKEGTRVDNDAATAKLNATFVEKYSKQAERFDDIANLIESTVVEQVKDKKLSPEDAQTYREFAKSLKESAQSLKKSLSRFSNIRFGIKDSRMPANEEIIKEMESRAASIKSDIEADAKEASQIETRFKAYLTVNPQMSAAFQKAKSKRVDSSLVHTEK